MRHPRVLDKEQAVLLVVDIQEAFRKHLPEPDVLSRNVSVLLQAAKIFQLPVFITEQYPQGLGSTFSEIKANLPEHKYFEKQSFSCCGSEEFSQSLQSIGRRQVIICGIEAHVCVNQTTHDLLARQYQVHVITDAIASRLPANKAVGVEKMVASGAVRSCLEMCLFEMLIESGTETFKSVQRLIK